MAAANRLTGQETVQFVLDFPRIYTNTQVIAKPPVKTSNETMGSALDSFYSDIASLERQPVEAKPIIEASPLNVSSTNEDQQQPVLLAPSLPTETEKINNDAALKDKDNKKKKKVSTLLLYLLLFNCNKIYLIYRLKLESVKNKNRYQAW